MIDANYGSQAKPRQPKKYHKHGKGRKGGKNENVECSDPQSLVKVKDECNGRQACEFTVSDLFNEDDCINEEMLAARSGSRSGNDNQLRLDYKCIPRTFIKMFRLNP